MNVRPGPGQTRTEVYEETYGGVAMADLAVHQETSSNGMACPAFMKL